MKVTALIPDELIQEVRDLSNGKNITDALVIALSEWISQKRIRTLNQKIKVSPLQFKSGWKASEVRRQNRNR